MANCPRDLASNADLCGRYHNCGAGLEWLFSSFARKILLPAEEIISFGQPETFVPADFSGISSAVGFLECFNRSILCTQEFEYWKLYEVIIDDAQRVARKMMQEIQKGRKFRKFPRGDYMKAGV